MNKAPQEHKQNDLYFTTKYSYELVEKILTEEHKKEDIKLTSSGRLTSYNVGDIVFVARNFVGDRAYKIKYPFSGPYRVENVNGNTVTVLNLTNGQPRVCSMRNIKIYKADDLNKSDNKNVNKIFPLASNNPNDEEIFNEIPPSNANKNVRKTSKEPTVQRQYELRSRNKPKELKINSFS